MSLMSITSLEDVRKFLVEISEASQGIKETRKLLRAAYSKDQGNFFVNFLDHDGKPVREKMKEIYGYADYVARTRSKREGKEFLRSELQSLRQRLEKLEYL